MTRELTPKGKKIVRLAVALGVILVGLIGYWAIRSRSTTPSLNQPANQFETPTPTGFSGQLPYTGDGFTIDYQADDNTYVVNIYREPVEELKAEANRYLERHGAKIPPSKVTYFLGPDVSEHTGP